MKKVDWRRVVEAAKALYGDEWWRFIAELKTMHSSEQYKAIEELLRQYEKAIDDYSSGS